MKPLGASTEAESLQLIIFDAKNRCQKFYEAHCYIVFPGTFSISP